MSTSSIPKLNQVSLIGTIYDDASISTVEHKRVVTFGLSTHEADGRVHRIVVHDEFLAQSLHGQLRKGASLSVMGELAIDDIGCHVAVTSRRGSDLYLIGMETAHDEPAATVTRHAPDQNQAPVTPQSQPRPAATVPPAAVTPPRTAPAQTVIPPKPGGLPARPTVTTPSPQRPLGTTGTGRPGGLAALRAVPNTRTDSDERQDQDDHGSVRTPLSAGSQRPVAQPIPGRSLPARPAAPPARPSLQNTIPPSDPSDDDIPF